MNLEQIFRDNLKYISNLELDCSKISQQFTKTKTRDHVVIGHVDLPTWTCYNRTKLRETQQNQGFALI